MRKILTILLSIVMSVALVACNNTKDKDTKNKNESKVTEEAKDNKDNKDNKEQENKLPVVAIGQPYKTDKYEITVHGYEWTKAIEPANPGDFYSYYQAEEGSTFLRINATIKNIGSETVNIDGIAYEASINDQYNYKLQTAIEKSGDLGGLAMVKPLEQVNAIIFTSIPNEAKDSLQSLRLYCGFNDGYDNQFDTYESKEHKVEFALQ